MHLIRAAGSVQWCATPIQCNQITNYVRGIHQAVHRNPVSHLPAGFTSATPQLIDLLRLAGEALCCRRILQLPHEKVEALDLFSDASESDAEVRLGYIFRTQQEIHFASAWVPPSLGAQVRAAVDASTRKAPDEAPEKGHSKDPTIAKATAVVHDSQGARHFVLASSHLRVYSRGPRRGVGGPPIITPPYSYISDGFPTQRLTFPPRT